MDYKSKDLLGNGETLDYAQNNDINSVELNRILSFLAGDIDAPDDIPIWPVLENSVPNRQTKSNNPEKHIEREAFDTSSKIFASSQKYSDSRKKQLEEIPISPSWESCWKLVWEHTIKYSAFNRSICRDVFVERIQRIGRLAAKSLRTQGFFTLKDLLGVDRASAIYNWAVALRANLPHTFRRGQLCNSDNMAGEHIRTDFVAWFSTDKVPTPADSIPGFPEVRLLLFYMDAIIRAIGSDLLGSDGCPALIDSRSWSAISFFKRHQPDNSNPVGYTAHYDNPKSLSDGRVLTALYYLNPVWQKQWGGQLTILRRGIHPHQNSPIQSQPIHILPTLDRIVLFYSDERALHKVQPVSFDSPVESRIAIGTWYFDRRERDLHILRQTEKQFSVH